MYFVDLCHKKCKTQPLEYITWIHSSFMYIAYMFLASYILLWKFFTTPLDINYNSLKNFYFFLNSFHIILFWKATRDIFERYKYFFRFIVFESVSKIYFEIFRFLETFYVVCKLYKYLLYFQKGTKPPLKTTLNQNMKVFLNGFKRL